MKAEGERLAFLGLGSNLGERRDNLLAALRILDGTEGIRVLEVSSVYETSPWGVLEQPDFLNLVALVATTRGPRGLLEACTGVEEALGRERKERWGPRVIDVDILLVDDIELEEDDLVIPHPRMLERDFVMVPLLELRPAVIIPGMGEARRHYARGDLIDARAAFRFDKEEWHG